MSYMQISRLKIYKLFGVFSYNIDFNGDIDSPLTIITGPNGYGKTTICKIINSLSSRNLYALYALKFQKIEVTFDDQSNLVIVQNLKFEPEDETGSADVKMKQSKEVLFSWMRDGETTSFASFAFDKKNIQKAIRALRYDDIEIIKSERSLSPKQFDEYLQTNERFINKMAQSPEQNAFIMNLQLIRVKYISANRIYNECKTDQQELPIDRIGSSLKDKLNSTRADFLNLSERENELFIDDILSESQSKITEKEYNTIATRLQQQAEKLKLYNITNKFNIPPFSNDKKTILASYIKHLEKKLKCCEEILEKMELFDNMLKSKKFANKRITFAPAYGLRVAADSGEFIDASLLSSGEQSEVVLLYNLIFDVADRSILLVDEPENSLHVAWQKMVVTDLQKIAKVKNLQLIIATHSPSIVSQGTDVAKDLYYINEGNAQYRT